MATTNDLKNGMTLDIDGQLWTVVEFQHVKPGKGPAFVRTKLKQVLTGKVVDKTFNAGVKIEIAILEKREMNFLYKEGEDFVFMDNKTFDQMNISAATVGDAANYMLENTEAIVATDDVAISRFTSELDSAVVMVNASTRFTDGGEFGFGAEIGISTQKLHARGPMGLQELTTSTYVVVGDGHTRH